MKTPPNIRPIIMIITIIGLNPGSLILKATPSIENNFFLAGIVSKQGRARQNETVLNTILSGQTRLPKAHQNNAQIGIDNCSILRVARTFFFRSVSPTVAPYIISQLIAIVKEHNPIIAPPDSPNNPEPPNNTPAMSVKITMARKFLFIVYLIYSLVIPQKI